MPRALPPLTWLRSFECAARHLSFTGAARELNLTQPAISQQVRALETRFGVTLFERRPRGLALTDAGRRLLPEVSSGLGTLARAAHTFEVGQDRGLLTVAASVSFIQWFLAPALADFHSAHPGIQIRIISTVWPDEFHASVADVEIRFGSKALVGKDARRLRPDTLIAVAAPHLARAGLDGAAALIESVGTSHGWQPWARHVGHPGRLEPAIFVDSHGLAVDLACGGAGIALTSSLIAASALADGRLARVHPGEIESEDGYFVACTRREDGLSDRFRHWLDGLVARTMA